MPPGPKYMMMVALSARSARPLSSIADPAVDVLPSFPPRNAPSVRELGRQLRLNPVRWGIDAPSVVLTKRHQGLKPNNAFDRA